MRRVAFAALLATVGFAQSDRPEFEVASVKMYAPGTSVSPESQGFSTTPDGIRAVHVTMRGCLQWAYNIVDVSGPPWISQESYDIIVKATAGGGDLRLMTQTLLETRFQLKVHRETKQALVGVLVVFKTGVKNLHPIDNPGPVQISRVDGKLEIKNAPMSRVAGVLGSPLGIMPLEKTIDETGLSGAYDITLDFRNFDPKDPEFAGNYQAMRAALSDFVSQTLERSYGLKLERRMMPVETLMVDSGSKVPTEN
ncbi:MAG: TIGR03435 family protein [Bryobacterales bacterium]|nr:TIGR03435 family protein [Bryobacterales bacterium]MBV9398144.1 TIGR03435 family protein [Bryobacterales bacterium]